MSKPTIETVAPSKIAEVKAFLKAKAALDELRSVHPSVFRAILDLQAPYMTTRKVAAEVLKEKRVSCGPFELFKFEPKYDGQALYDAVGRQRFASMGGELEPEKPVVNRAKFAALMAMEKVEPELEAKVVTWTPYFHAPPELSIP